MFGPLAKCYEGIAVHAQPMPGDVQFVFHTYHGFLAFFVQTEHRISASPAEARKLLWQLHRFNMTWGMFAAGAAFVPILSFFNYRTQKRALAKQAAA